MFKCPSMFGDMRTIAEAAIRDAQIMGEAVSFEFQGMDIVVYPQSYSLDICRIIELMRESAQKEYSESRPPASY